MPLSAPSSLLSARTPYQVVSRVLLHLQPCHSSYSCFSSHAPKLVPTKISRTRHGASKFRDRPVPLVAPSACHQPNRLVKPTPTSSACGCPPCFALRRGLPRALGPREYTRCSGLCDEPAMLRADTCHRQMGRLSFGSRAHHRAPRVEWRPALLRRLNVR